MTKYATIASDPLVKRWLANLRRGSRATASVAERRFGKTLEFLNELLEAKKQGKLRRQRVGADKMTPSRLLRDAKRNPKRFQDLLEDLVAERELKGNAPGYISGLLKSIRSMLRYHDVVLNRRIKISNVNSTPTIEYEQIPSQEELSRIFRASPSRTRVAEVLMAFADLRPEPMGNIDGTDGLMLKDLPELKVRANEAVFETVPTMIIVRSTLSKAGHKYFTFLSSEGCTYLKEYLDGRLRKGESLVPEGPIIGHERPGASFKPFLSTTNISDDVRECMREAGVRKRRDAVEVEREKRRAEATRPPARSPAPEQAVERLKKEPAVAPKTEEVHEEPKRDGELPVITKVKPLLHGEPREKIEGGGRKPLEEKLSFAVKTKEMKSGEDRKARVVELKRMGARWGIKKIAGTQYIYARVWIDGIRKEISLGSLNEEMKQILKEESIQL